MLRIESRAAGGHSTVACTAAEAGTLGVSGGPNDSGDAALKPSPLDAPSVAADARAAADTIAERRLLRRVRSRP